MCTHIYLFIIKVSVRLIELDSKPNKVNYKCKTFVTAILRLLFAGPHVLVLRHTIAPPAVRSHSCVVEFRNVWSACCRRSVEICD